MTDRPCPVDRCDATLGRDEEICRGCSRRLTLELRAVPHLLEELDTSLARIGSGAPDGTPRGAPTGGCRPGCRHEADNPSCVAGVRLDVNLAASDAAAYLRAVLQGWARVWDEETPLAIPGGDQSGPARLRAARARRDFLLATARRQALLLAGQPLAARPWAGDLANEVHAAVRAAERAIDTPPDVTLAGTCPCGTPVYGVAGDTRARCRACGTWHDAQDLHDAMLQARGHLHTAPAAVIARLLVDPTTGKPMCTAAQIRGWRHRGLLEVAEVNPAGQPCYRIDRVAVLAARAATEEEPCPT